MVNEFPMTAGLAHRSREVVFCGATIIAQYFAVTAAHCILNRNLTEMGLLVGDHDYRSGKVHFVHI